MSGGMSSFTIVIWLLRRFGIALRNDALVGDLLEEYASGRSARWLWWQALVIIAMAAVGDLRDHKALALRAIGTGLLVILTASALKQQLTSQPWASGLPAFWALTLLSFLLAGWVVSLTHRAHKAGMLLAFLLYAAFAKAWVYTSHFHHYWNMAEPYRFASDAGLTAVGLLCVIVGGLFAPPGSSEPGGAEFYTEEV